MRRRTFALLLALILLPGCASSKDGGPPSLTTASEPPAAENDTREPPVADFYPSTNPVFPNVTITFDASNSGDPEGGNLSYAWDFGDGAKATGVQADHGYAAPGTFRVTLVVESDLTNKTGQGSLSMLVLDPADVVGPVILADPDSDGKTDPSDLVGVGFFDGGDRLFVQFVVQDLPEGVDVASPIHYAFFVNGSRYELYAAAGELKVWNAQTSQDMLTAEAQMDADANALFASVTYAELAAGREFPVHAETRLGDPARLHGQVVDDRVPDSGDVQFPQRGAPTP